MLISLACRALDCQTRYVLGISLHIILASQPFQLFPSPLKICYLYFTLECELIPAIPVSPQTWRGHDRRRQTRPLELPTSLRCIINAY